MRWLQVLEIRPNNMREFIHSSDNKWMSHFDEEITMDPDSWCSDFESNRQYILHLFLLSMPMISEIYAYPEEDFCMFQHYHPWHLVVFEIIDTPDQLDINNCLQYFLSRMNICGKRQQKTAYDYPDDPDYEKFKSFIRDMDDKCRVDHRLDLCSSQNFSSRQSQVKELTLYDWTYALQFAEFVGPIVLFPFVSVTGLVLNILVILVISSKTNQKMHFKGNRIYTYIQLNSVFNAIECLISSLTLMNECLGANSIYCSSIEQNYFVQLFKIAVVEYVGEVMKTCSIFMMLAFSIERYIQVSESKRALALKFQQVKASRLTAVVVCLSSALSVCKVFEYSIEFSIANDSELPNMKLATMIQKPWFNVLYVAHFVINDFILLVVNLAIDLLLVVHIRGNLKKKDALTTEVGTSQKDVDRRLKEKQAAERNTNKLLVYQIIMFILCRFPELTFRIHILFIENIKLYSTPFKYPEWCQTQYFCYLLANNVQFLYMISYSANVYFLTKFNRPFREGLRVHISGTCRRCLKRSLNFTSVSTFWE